MSETAVLELPKATAPAVLNLPTQQPTPPEEEDVDMLTELPKLAWKGITSAHPLSAQLDAADDQRTTQLNSLVAADLRMFRRQLVDEQMADMQRYGYIDQGLEDFLAYLRTVRPMGAVRCRSNVVARH